jgi:solute carrier family 15 (peptide/histidine transporter), member 3/4
MDENTQSKISGSPESMDVDHAKSTEAKSTKYEHQAMSLSPFDLSGTLSSQVKGDGEKRANDPDALPWRENPMYTRTPFILGQEFCERLAYYGIATNIITYMTSELAYTNSQAASYQNIWSGMCYLTPLLGAFLADSYMGRFLVILVFSLIYMIGLALLTVSAGVPSLTPATGESLSTVQAFAFWMAMSLIALGTGGIKPNVSTFGADQFDPDDIRHRRQIPRFFNLFYAMINGGAILSALVVVNVQTGVSWWVGFLIPCVSFVVATVLFVGGSRLYRRVNPGGSPFTRIWRTVVIARRKRRCLVERTEDLFEVDGDMSVIVGQPKLGHTEGMAWLDKAAVITEADHVGTKHLDIIREDVEAGSTPVQQEPQDAAPRNNLATVTETESVKAMIRLLPIGFTFIFYCAIYAQMLSLFVLQGNGMNTQIGAIRPTAATVTVLDSISVIIFVIIYDMLLVPGLKKIGHPISPLVRIGVGYVIAIVSMLVAGCIEIARLNVAADEGLTDVEPVFSDPSTIPSMSVWWQVPQYCLVAISEVFSLIGTMELFYQQAPDAMRSCSAALQLLCVGIGSYVAAALVAIVQAITTSGGKPGWIADNLNQGHLDYFFFTLAVIMALVGILYIFIARRFTYRNLDHVTYEPGVVGLCSDRLCTPTGFNRTLAQQIDSGVLSAESLGSSRMFAGGSSRRRTTSGP